MDHNPIYRAAFTLGNLIKISPFDDGVEVLARLFMNYQLLSYGFLPISFGHNDKSLYYKAIDSYVTDNDISYLYKLIGMLEEKQLLICLEGANWI